MARAFARCCPIRRARIWTSSRRGSVTRPRALPNSIDVPARQNVVSELRRARRTDPNVAAWAESVPQEDMFLSSVTILELEMGALRLAWRDGDRGRAIQRW